jgi:hypothetical protein
VGEASQVNRNPEKFKTEVRSNLKKEFLLVVNYSLNISGCNLHTLSKIGMIAALSLFTKLVLEFISLPKCFLTSGNEKKY